MKTQSRIAKFVDRFINYLKNPNVKNEAALFGTPGAEQAARAAINRNVRHQQRAGVRRNSRGLPVGIGPHQLRAAKRVKNQVANNPEAVIGETRLHAAETVLAAVKKNAAVRAQRPRPSKLARRMAALY